MGSRATAALVLNSVAVGTRREAFRTNYMSADRRVLGLARIAFGFVLVYDLIRRARVLDLLYTNEGVLPNHFVLFEPQARPQFSLLMGFSTPAEARVEFALIFLVYALYTLGLFTKLSQILVLLVFTSLNTRNLFVEDGGISTMISFSVWSVFLPLGDRFSLDALRRQASLPNLRARIRARRELRMPVVSLAVLALTLQIVVIYWLNAVHKTGPTWRHGEAVHYVLWQNRVTTPFAWWLAHHEPPYFSWLATKGTLLVEYTIPVLVLYPGVVWTRVVAFGLSVALHGGIALLMTLGPFSYAMMTLVLSRVPGDALDWVAKRRPRHLARGLVRRRAAWTAWLARRVPHAPAPRPAAVPLPWGKLREGTVAFLMVAAGVELSQVNPGVRLKLPQPDWLRMVVMYPRLTQRWSMFAPHAPTDDGFGVVDAVTADGRHVNPFTGEAPDFEAMNRGPIKEKIETADYLFSVHFPPNERYRRELARYIDRYHEREGLGPKDRIVSYDVYWVSHDSPPPGSVTPGPLRREPFLRSRHGRLLQIRPATEAKP